ncbi:MAG TPA: hypothetical protein VIX87_10265 [Steroidobacteraceae bacterium]
MSVERALFAGAPAAMPAGTDTASAPVLAPGRLYALQLHPVAQVSFETTPGRHRAPSDEYAGLAALRIAHPGSYRIAVDAPFWVDVVADGGLMDPRAFQGAPGCSAPHKILEFEFPVARQLVLQFSGAADHVVRLSITPAHDR